MVAKLWDSDIFLHLGKSMNYGGKPLRIIFLGVYSNLSDPMAIWRDFEPITGLPTRVSQISNQEKNLPTPTLAELIQSEWALAKEASRDEIIAPDRLYDGF